MTKGQSLILLGPPGAGKGTQAAKIALQMGWPHVSTGDMLRAARQAGTPLGEKARAYMDRGDLVPDDVIVGLIEERLAAPDTTEGVVLDGFPRTTVQAELLDGLMQRVDRPLPITVLIEVSREEILTRLTGRLTCERCQEVFHVKTRPPRVAGVCDACGGKLVQRSDDSPETVERRLTVYEEQTAPLIGYYRSRGRLLSVNGEGSPESVTTLLLGAIT